MYFVILAFFIPGKGHKLLNFSLPKCIVAIMLLSCVPILTLASVDLAEDVSSNQQPQNDSEEKAISINKANNQDSNASLNNVDLRNESLVTNENILSNEIFGQNDTSDQTLKDGLFGKIKLKCVPVFRDDSNMTSQLVLVNTSTIGQYLKLKIGSALELTTQLLTRSQSNQTDPMPGQCTVLIFFLEWCPFSAAAAPHFNALGRLYPQMNVIAIDAYSLYGTTMRYGVVGVPSFYMFHNNKVISKFNRSENTIEQFVSYIRYMTTLEPVGEVNITDADLDGPLSSKVTPTFNYLFVSSWAFCLVVALYYFTASDVFRRIKEHVNNMWNEAQFQHEHVE